jgi:hypothetical protein
MEYYSILFILFSIVNSFSRKLLASLMHTFKERFEELNSPNEALSVDQKRQKLIEHFRPLC